jgi:flavorubredoxin
MLDTKVLQITNDVHWIEVLDKDIRTFDIVMETQYGTTYNSYFINATQKAVVEVVKEKFFPVFEAKLRQLCNPEEISYIFINHTEPDHSGGLKKLLEIAPNATVVASNSAIMNLKEQLNMPFSFITANDGHITDLGKEYLAHYPERNRIMIAFVSAYGYTKKIAEKLKEGVEKVPNVRVDFCDIEKMDLVTLGEKIARSDAYLLGSPTINQNMLPQLYSLFALMTPLRDRGKPAAAFGAYGWSGEAKQNLIANIDNLKLNRYCESMFVKFIPSLTEEENIVKFGESFAKMM